MAAHQAMQAGRLEAARDGLVKLLQLNPAMGQAWHLLALVERRRDDTAAARSAFSRALALLPKDPQVHNNMGNFHDAQGDAQSALASYARAIVLKPDFSDAHMNQGIVALRMGKVQLAIRSLEQATASNPRLAKAWLVLGQAFMAEDRLREAAAAVDRALAIDGSSASALAARAIIAADRGEADATARFRRARAVNPDDRGLLLRTTAAQIADGDSSALDSLQAAVVATPDWIEGQRVLAKARFEAGEGVQALSVLENAIAAEPTNADLWMTLLHLEGAVRPATEMLDRVRAARKSLGERVTLDVAEAEFALRAGLPELATPLLSKARGFADMEAATALALGSVAARVAIRMRDPGQAAKILLAVRTELPVLRWNMGLWAHTETAWRMMGDSQHGWLINHPGLWATHELALPDPDRLADCLRGLHKRKAHPLDQSLRGGSQTEGTLFLRDDPAIAALKAAITQAVADHVAALPEPIEGHPTLDATRLRAQWRFAGSWSVRLSGAGFHVAHMHPEGWLSSALYVALPELDGEEGWLALGEPPEELAAGLTPLAMVRPKAGRLVLFPSWLWHGTRPFPAGERLTVAFDIAVDRAN